jgi:TIGR03009 family protein
MKPLAAAVLAVLFGSAAFAQAPAVPTAKETPPPSISAAMSEKNKQYLEKYLEAWEKRMAKIDHIETKAVYTVVDQDGKKHVSTGDAAILKPNYAKMLLKPVDDPTNTREWMHFVADGKFFRHYDYGQKIIRTEKLSREGVTNVPMMSFLFMTTAADLKKRYEMAIDVDDPKRTTEHYLYIEIRPKTRDDMLEFKKAELVLWKNNKDPKFADQWMLPARLWFQKPNGEQIVWQFQDMTTTKKLLSGDFEAPSPPDKSWKADWLRPPTPQIKPASGTGK